jgi:predicted outer membrane repeat protein
MANFTVGILSDDAFNNGDLIAETADGGGLSLREAIALANGNGATPDTITFQENLAGGTLTLTNAPGFRSLNITTDGVTINGDVNNDGTPDITISGNNAGSVFQISNSPLSVLQSGSDNSGTISATLNGLVIRDGAGSPHAYSGPIVSFTLNLGGGIYVGPSDSLTLTNSTLADNSASNSGGGIFVNYGAATLDNVTLTGNHAGHGGGIADFEGNIALTNTTLAGNSAVDSGGGIYATGVATLTNTTLAGNTASFGGGINVLDGNLTLINSTLSGNAASPNTFGPGSGGGIYNDGGVVKSGNSIIAGNAAAEGADFESRFNTPLDEIGPNIIGGPLTDIFASVVSVDPDGAGGVAAFNAGALADNGGPVQTIAIRQGGIAHDTGADAALPQTDPQDLDGDTVINEPLPVDARGAPRVDGATVDIGAVELQATPANMIVTTLDDGGDDAYSNGDIVAETADGDGLSLREALALANGNADANTIRFQGNLAGGTLFLASGAGDLDITSNLTIDGDIDGDGDADITISADSAPGVDDATSRVFNIDDGGLTAISATLNGLVIRDGYAVGGGGIALGFAESLTLSNSTVADNSTPGGTGPQGGGIRGSVNNTIMITNSTLSGNFSGEGGAISSGDGTLTLIHTTVVGNSAHNNGGGIANIGTLTLIDSTLSNNSALFGGVTRGGAIFNGFEGTLTLTNTTVWGNSALRGGGIYNGTGAGTTATLTNSTVTGNVASNSGGGISNAFGGTLTLVNSIVTRQ